MADVVRARHWCPRCGKPGAWFATREDIAVTAIVRSLALHQAGCPTVLADRSREAA